MFNNSPANATADPKQQLINTVNDELGSLKRRITEIKAQITQQQSMVDREEQRNTDIAAGLLAIRNNIDTMPREDIRDRYDSALDARQRLATMRGQLERFQATLELMQGQLVAFQSISSHISGVDLTSDDFDLPGDNAGKAAVVPAVSLPSCLCRLLPQQNTKEPPSTSRRAHACSPPTARTSVTTPAASCPYNAGNTPPHAPSI